MNIRSSSSIGFPIFLIICLTVVSDNTKKIIKYLFIICTYQSGVFCRIKNTVIDSDSYNLEANAFTIAFYSTEGQ